MPITGHHHLERQLLPPGGSLTYQAGKIARTEIQPLGKLILSQEIRRVMDVQDGTFEKTIRMQMLTPGYGIEVNWLVQHPGANIQDRGGTIRARKIGSRLLFLIPGVGWRAPHEVTLKARPYLTPAINRIRQRSTPLLERRLARFLGGGR